MTREISAHHDPAASGPDLGAVMRLHPAVPVYSVVDVCRAASSPGAVRNAVLHFWNCVGCSPAEMCSDGLRLVERLVAVMPPIRQRQHRGQP
jgi:hypothetical protein